MRGGVIRSVDVEEVGRLVDWPAARLVLRGEGLCVPLVK